MGKERRRSNSKDWPRSTTVFLHLRIQAKNQPVCFFLFRPRQVSGKEASTATSKSVPSSSSGTAHHSSSNGGGGGAPLTSEHIALRGLRLLRRPSRLRAVLALPRHTHLSESCRWACERLGVEASHASSTDAAVALCTGAGVAGGGEHASHEQVHLVVLDARNTRHVDAEAVAR